MSYEVGIPSIDLALYTQGTQEQQQQFVQQLLKAYEEIGLVAV